MDVSLLKPSSSSSVSSCITLFERTKSNPFHCEMWNNSSIIHRIVPYETISRFRSIFPTLLIYSLLLYSN